MLFCTRLETNENEANCQMVTSDSTQKMLFLHSFGNERKRTGAVIKTSC